MPRVTAAAKAAAKRRAKAQAKRRSQPITLSNIKRSCRQAAVRTFNTLAVEMSLDAQSLDAKAPSDRLLEQYLRLLSRRCVVDPAKASFYTAVRKWVDNGGRLPGALRLAAGGELVDEAADGGATVTLEMPSAVPRHKVLAVGFELKSKAFMCTHDSRAFTRETWPTYRAWACALGRRLATRGWAACMEVSENAQSESLTDDKVLQRHREKAKGPEAKGPMGPRAKRPRG